MVPFSQWVKAEWVRVYLSGHLDTCQFTGSGVFNFDFGELVERVSSHCRHPGAEGCADVQQFVSLASLGVWLQAAFGSAVCVGRLEDAV